MGNIIKNTLLGIVLTACVTGNAYAPVKNIDSYIEKAEQQIKSAKKFIENGNGAVTNWRACHFYQKAIYHQLNALYNQNKVIIDLLKSKNE